MSSSTRNHSSTIMHEKGISPRNASFITAPDEPSLYMKASLLIQVLVEEDLGQKLAITGPLDIPKDLAKACPSQLGIHVQSRIPYRGVKRL